MIDGSDTILTLLQRPPLYLGGPSKMRYVSYRMIQLPKKAIEIQVSFLISTTGIARDFKVLNPTDNRLDKEAINKVAQLSRNWLPAMLNGKYVMIEHTLTVSFKRVNRSVYTSPTFMRSNAIGNYVDPGLYRGRTSYYGTYYTAPRSTRVDYTTCEIQVR